MNTSTLNKSGSLTRLGGQGPLPAAASNNQNHLLEKVNARTSTPDSEALASSDDEGDHRFDASQPIAPPQKPTRRPSWLNDTSQPLIRPRKGSFASGSKSPTTSNPTTPSADPGTGPWGPSAVMGRAHNPTSFAAWGSGIWNAERKDHPARLAEVLPSPTSTVPPGSSGIFGPDTRSQTSPKPRESGSNAQIPFAIPLHPTPKTYRSQSYSVGQMEPEAGTAAGMTSSQVLGRARHPALQHRPSRPSMLSEMANDGSMLGEVKEVDDDDDEGSTSDSMQGSFYQSTESETIKMLTRENARLRQQQYNARVRPRASTGAAYLTGNGYALQGTVPEEADLAIDELDEQGEGGESFARRAANRRMSEYAAAPFRSALGENRKAENLNLKKALWSTSNFNGGDGSQSRRHSFANIMPTRQGSISSIADTASTLDASAADSQVLPEYVSGVPDNAGYSLGAMHASFIPGNAQFGGHIPQSFGNSQYPQAFGAQPAYVPRAPSPHRNAYGMAQPRHNQLLHIVLFKCARADVFYIQEGTGLTVKPGDLVIVEADRGTDLGTVARDNVDWQTAKDLKEHYAEEHYKWLMMYSQGAAAASDGSGGGLLASASGLHASAVGGMGPTQHHMQEPATGELRPKLIKRLAQSHEVHSLRDKEGQEAKAKRVCMQKVKEHGLSMEILDAEFQMDWKKLTFYYFADAYINFNSLVTDLFKIYKTRIWMSAINPASFASPTLGIQAPSGVGPGAVNASRTSNGGERRQPPQIPEQQPSMYAPAAQATRAPRPATFAQPLVGDRGAPPVSGYGGIAYGYGQAGLYGHGRGNPPGNPGYQQSMPMGMDNFSGAGYQQFGDYQTMRHRFPAPQGIPSPGPHSQGMSPMAPHNDWSSAFQGLSLNTH